MGETKLTSVGGLQKGNFIVIDSILLPVLTVSPVTEYLILSSEPRFPATTSP